MLGALISFELRRRLKMLSSYVYAAILFAGGFFLMAIGGGLFRNMSTSTGNERVFANGPASVFANLNVMALMGLFTVAAIFGQAAYQDFGTGTWPLIFTRNVKKVTYLAGRFLGAYFFSCVLFLAIAAGMLLGALVTQGAAMFHLIDTAQIGPHRLDVYLWPYLVSVWPMLFITGALFFSLAALTRQMAPVYVGVVVLVLGYLVLSTAIGDVQNRTVGALADPFGFLTYEVVTRYWTPQERNTELVPLWGLMLLNKLIWTAVGLALLGLTVNRFRTTVDEQKGTKPTGRQDAPEKLPPLPSTRSSPTTAGWWRTVFATGWLHFRDITRSAVYWSFICAGLLFVLIGVLIAGEIFGTATLPVTWQMLEMAGGTFSGFVIITLTFYAGELVWKERDAQAADIIDASRVPTWVPFLSKLVALFLVTASLQLVIGAAALAAQVSRGFFDIEWRLYAMDLIVFGVLQDVLIAVLALLVQVLVNQKYLGHGAIVLYYVSQMVLNAVGVEERLIRFNSEPRIAYSDMNGYGHWLPASMVFRGYWWSIASVLVVIAFLLFVRGREATWKRRRAIAWDRFTGAWRAFAALGVAGALALGGFIYRETHVRHAYRTAKDGERAQARYEKEWKSWSTKATPRIVDADVNFDIYPEASPPRLEAKGTYLLANKTEEPISEVLLNLVDDAKVEALAIGASTTPKQKDDELGLQVFALDPPLQPGEQRPLTFSLTFQADPIVHGSRRQDVVGNGTFFNNFNLPIVGYQDDNELIEDGDRKSYDLAPKERMLDRDDPKGLQRNYIRSDSDFIGFRSTVSTSADQIAVAPGTLTKEWTENGRRFFRYEMNQPILNFFSVLSARYTVKEDRWNQGLGADGTEGRSVKLQIFYEQKHPYNLDRMMQGMKDALAYCSENFGPYQHQQARVLEFPRYAGFAQSFPNTIPYSEGLGFIARVRDDNAEDLDYPYYVTAHEIAHQWWAHQVVGGDTQGATVTSESMAQYSALMVMKKKYGPEKMRRFLKFELDRYLMGRATERKKELPLSRVENQQYIHYQKGSLVMFWLQDVVGEDVINRGLKKYVDAVRFKGPPYTNSTQLISFLRAEIPPEHHGLLDDLFETITVYDNRAVSASMKQNAAGAWDVTVKVKAVKYRSDDKGNQTELEFNDVMEVGAIDDDGNGVFLEKRKVAKGESELKFTVPVKPARVGLDPLNKLVDRTSDDNTTAPTME
jgi:ABC-2 type transport system permease protein